MAKNKQLNLDQNQFSQQSPVLEEAHEELAQPDPVSTQQTQTKKPNKKLLIAIVVFLFVIILVLMGVLLFVEPPAEKQPQPTNPTPTPAVKQADDKLEKQLQEVKQSLEAADPAKKELPFPPVELEINLEE